MADEGCDGMRAGGICESPIGCGVGGARFSLSSGSTGTLVVPVPPDITVQTPYGPSLILQRTLNTHYFHTTASWNNPFGTGWHHNYMSWVKKNTAVSPNTVIVHSPEGYDALFTYSSNDGTYNYFAPQIGTVVQYFRQKTASGTGQYNYELKELNGRILRWKSITTGGSPTSGSGTFSLMEIEDATGAKLTLEYTGYAATPLSTVTSDLGGVKRRLRFEYTYDATLNPQSKVRYVKVESEIGGTTTVHETFEYSYQSANAYSLWKFGISGGATITEYTGLVGSNQTIGFKDAAGNADYTIKTNGSGNARLVDAPNGGLGLTYGDSSCDSGNGVLVFFNRTSTTCTSDTQCSGTSTYCGGSTGATNSGYCFKAKRCLTISRTSGEDLISSVAASCGSASADLCLKNKAYSWDVSGAIYALKGIESADDVWTSYSRDANGMVTKMVEADTDDDASTVPSSARTTFYTYTDSNFPSFMTEERRLSVLYPSGTCTSSTTTNCKRTIYTYTSLGKVDTKTEDGFTYDSTGAITAYSYVEDWDYDGSGRVTTYYGPRSGIDDNTEYTYHSGTTLSTGYVNETKRKKSSGVYLTTTTTSYSIWGKPESLQEPENLTCYTYDGDTSGQVATRQQLTSGSCSSSPVGPTTSFTYDSHRRLSLAKKPKGNCVAYSYSSTGRLSTILESDNNGSGGCESTGHSKVYTYDTDGNLTKEQYKDSGGSVTWEHEVTIATHDRVATIKNPESAASKTLDYFDDGFLSGLKLEDWTSGNRYTEAYTNDDLNRRTVTRKYTGSSTYEEWTSTVATVLDVITTVLDTASHQVDTAWDDMGRKISSYRLDTNVTLFNYDEAGNLLLQTWDLGGSDEKTTTWTFDALNRKIAEDTDDAPCYTLGGPEIEWTYDALPGGVSCPSGITCGNLSGRLAYVKSRLWCENNEPDDMFDQITLYGYDELGQVTKQYVADDAGRESVLAYAYDDNGNMTQEAGPYAPGAASPSPIVAFTFGGVAANDDDKLTAIDRDSVTWFWGMTYLPFGPLTSYQNGSGYCPNSGSGTTHLYQCNPMSTFTNTTATLQYNKAYRPKTGSGNKTSWIASTTNMLSLEYDEDARGRTTKRLFTSTGPTGNQHDMYLLYDDLGRVTCRRDSSGSTCPTSGYRQEYSYNSSDDLDTATIDNAVYSNLTRSYSYATGAELPGSIGESTSYTVTLSYDRLGNQTADDSDEMTSPDDLRTFTYDGRNQLTSVTGKYYVGFGAMHSYILSNGYDENGRRVSKMFKDTTPIGGYTSAWTFYYDIRGNLVRQLYIPNTSSKDDYQTFDWTLLEGRPAAQEQTTFATGVSPATSHRFLMGDAAGVATVWNWTAGDTSIRVWEADLQLWGAAPVSNSLAQLQPFRGSSYVDVETRVQNSAGGFLRDPLQLGLGSTHEVGSTSSESAKDIIDAILEFLVAMDEIASHFSTTPGHALGVDVLSHEVDSPNVPSGVVCIPPIQTFLFNYASCEDCLNASATQDYVFDHLHDCGAFRGASEGVIGDLFIFELKSLCWRFGTTRGLDCERPSVDPAMPICTSEAAYVMPDIRRACIDAELHVDIYEFPCDSRNSECDQRLGR